jgi:peptidoglycan/xylan/chitin deacetylase (PgdA/CDA1 family)
MFDEMYLYSHQIVMGDRPGVCGLLFHNVCANSKEIKLNHAHPQQGLVIDDYRAIFDYFLEYGYQFIGHPELTVSLNPEGKYVYVTFDDGYYNNLKIIPLIEELNIPINVFITTRNVVMNEKYWWDVVYQKRMQSGMSRDGIEKELTAIKRMDPDKIRIYILDQFGITSFNPISDIDRPLSVEELKALSQHQLITIGNHTQNHAIATMLSDQQVKKEIKSAQKQLEAITGLTPVTFAFPNGNYRRSHIAILQSMGFDTGFSCEARLNRAPKDIVGDRRFVMGRFCFSSNIDMRWQGKIFRVGASPYLMAQNVKSMIT